MDPWESTSVTTPQAWETCPSVSSRQRKEWSLTWSVRACSTPKTPRPLTAGWTMRKPSATERWCCATMTRPRAAHRTRLRASPPGCAWNRPGSSVSTCLSTAQTTGWFKRCVQTTAPRIPHPTCQKWHKVKVLKTSYFTCCIDFPQLGGFLYTIFVCLHAW